MLTSADLGRSACAQAFVVGHELAHIARRHFDEDAVTIAVLLGRPATWLRDGDEVLHLLDGDYGLVLRMSELWQQQEREADWLGALLAAQACGCRIEDSAMAYFRTTDAQGGGMAAAHPAKSERAQFLSAFSETARRLARRGAVGTLH